MSLISRMDHARKLNKRSIKSLAKPLSLSNTQVYNLFSGKSRMTVEQLEVICLEIGVNIELCYKESK